MLRVTLPLILALWPLAAWGQAEDSPPAAGAARDAEEGQGAEPDEGRLHVTDWGAWSDHLDTVSDRADALITRGLVSYRLDDVDQAYSDWREAWELDPLLYAERRGELPPALQEAMNEAKAWNGSPGHVFDEDVWCKVRLGMWFATNHELTLRVGSKRVGAGTKLRPDEALGVRDYVVSDWVDADQKAVLDLGVRFDGEDFGFALWFVPAFGYEGFRSLSRTITWGDQAYETGTLLASRFRYFYVGADFEWHAFQTERFRVSPLLALRGVGLDYNIAVVRQGVLGNYDFSVGTSEFIDFLPIGEFELLPYGELGLRVVASLHDMLRWQATLAGFYVYYLGVEGAILRMQTEVAFYPHPNIGIEVGYQFLGYDIATQGQRNFIDFEVRLHGLVTSLVLRF